MVEDSKDVVNILNHLDVVQTANMIADAWRETLSTIIWILFCKAGFKYHAVNPEKVVEDPIFAPTTLVW